MSIFPGHDAAVLATNHAGNKRHRNVINAAAETGVKHLIPNHWSSDAELPTIKQLSSYDDSLRQDIEYFRTEENSGMTWTAIVMAIFLDL